MMNSGCLVVVVGPSGTGKDILIAAASEFFVDDPGVRFVRCVGTRSTCAQGEPYECIDADSFERARQDGQFVVDWEVQGVRYGVPVQVLEDVRSGCLVVVNGSRAMLSHYFDAFPACHVIHVLVDSAVLEQRPNARGREISDDIKRHLIRRIEMIVPDGALTLIDNSDSMEAAEEAFIAELYRLGAGSYVPQATSSKHS